MPGPLNSRRPNREKTIGGLRHRVKIQRKAANPQQQPGGAEITTWQDVATVWAKVEAIGGREMMRNGQVQANTTYRVEMRHRGNVSPDMRLIWLTSVPANKVLNITTAPPTVGAGNSLELVCVEEV